MLSVRGKVSQNKNSKMIDVAVAASSQSLSSPAGGDDSKYSKRSFFSTNFQTQRYLKIGFIIFFMGVLGAHSVLQLEKSVLVTSNKDTGTFAPMGRIIYGAKSKKEQTGDLVAQAIGAGFRHIVIGGMQEEYVESAVGEGWKKSGVPRNELHLQTSFVAKSVSGWSAHDCHISECPPSDDMSIEDQVHLSIKSSLYNLQTTYIDSVLIHNFRAKLQPYDDLVRAYRVLEDYVDQNIIRFLGIVSCHDKEYLINLHNDARIKPSIIQNRFHGNRGYDVALRSTFKELGMANQLFWVLTGNFGYLKNETVKRIAAEKGISPACAMYAFTISLGASPLIGSKSLEHMQEDVVMMKKVSPFSAEDMKGFASAMGRPALVSDI